jgi:hypothetical protein
MVVFPCFAVMSESCVGGVVQPLDGEGIAIILLTDEDLLRDFRVKSEKFGPTIRFEFSVQLLMYLQSLPDQISHVLIDPSQGQPKLFSRADVIKALRRQLDSAAG